MRADLEVEFLVVGGGPVGSALALQLRRAGREVLLVDGGASPSKVCGEGLLPAAWEVLEELGVAPLVAARAPIRELTYQLVDPRDGRLRAIRAGLRHPSYGVRREVLCAAFAQAAREEGLEVWRPARFRSLQLEVAGCRVELELPSEQGGARRVACRYLLGADGLHSSVRRAAGLANPKPGRFARWGSRVYMRAPAGSGVVVTLGDGLECYQTPLDEGLCGLAFIWSPRLLGRPLPGRDRSGTACWLVSHRRCGTVCRLRGCFSARRRRSDRSSSRCSRHCIPAGVWPCWETRQATWTP